MIALGHAGYELDQQMAAEIEEIDVVVGGHSHTFLWTGWQFFSLTMIKIYLLDIRYKSRGLLTT